MKQLRIITGALWGLAILMFALGWILDSDDLEHGAILVGLAAGPMIVATAIRWGSQVLVHVLALYNDDLPTAEGARLISSLVPVPKHSLREVEVDGDGTGGR